MKLLGLLLAIGFMLGGGVLLLLSFGVEGFPMLRNAYGGHWLLCASGAMLTDSELS